MNGPERKMSQGTLRPTITGSSRMPGPEEVGSADKPAPILSSAGEPGLEAGGRSS